jgi:hypothetical protein
MIATIEQYNELAELADTGQDRLLTGSGESGVHYYIMHILRGHGICVMSREEAIRAARKLCNEYLETLNSGEALNG